MDYSNDYTAPAKHGTLGGLCLVMLSNITGSDLLKTVLLAAVGAAVSFIVSYGLKWLGEKWK